MERTKYVQASFDKHKYECTTKKVYQYDNGLVLLVKKVFGVHGGMTVQFETQGIDHSVNSITAMNSSGELTCRIPDELLLYGHDIKGYIYVQENSSTHYTIYEIYIPVEPRAASNLGDGRYYLPTDAQTTFEVRLTDGCLWAITT